MIREDPKAIAPHHIDVRHFTTISRDTRFTNWLRDWLLRGSSEEGDVSTRRFRPRVISSSKIKSFWRPLWLDGLRIQTLFDVLRGAGYFTVGRMSNLWRVFSHQQSYFGQKDLYVLLRVVSHGCTYSRGHIDVNSPSGWRSSSQKALTTCHLKI